jgi:hypothetical protein
VVVGEGRTVAAGAAGSRVAVTRPAWLWVLLLGAAVAAATGAYAGLHEPAGRPLTTLGFSGVLQMKAWLTSGAAVLLLVQLTTALWMWGRLPGAGRAPVWAGQLHRWSGTIAFVLTLPVAFHCIWSLGFTTDSTRVVVHGLAGCLFYGAYAAKMLGLRVRGLPGWGLPVLGGTVLASLVLIWFTSALWFFTRSGIPHT